MNKELFSDVAQGKARLEIDPVLGAGNAAVMDSPPFLGLVAGQHLCWMWRDEPEFNLGIKVFVSSCVKAREQALILTSSQKTYIFENLLRENSLDGEGVELACLDEVQNADGELDAAELVQRLSEIDAQARREQYCGLRVLLDMSFIAGLPLGINQIRNLVAKLDWLLAEQPLVLISAYEFRLFSPTRLLDLLPFYQVVSLGQKVLPNVYYSPSSQRRKGQRHALLLNEVLLKLGGGINTISDLSARVNGDYRAQVFPAPSEFEGFDAESMLRMMRTVIDSMSEGVIVVDASGRMLLFNKTASEILGYGFSELSVEERVRKYGNYLPDKVTPFPIEQAPVTRALRGEIVDQVEIYVRNERRPHGIWVSSSARPLRDTHGKSQGAVVVFRDITRQKEEQEERERAATNAERKKHLESLALVVSTSAHLFCKSLGDILLRAENVYQGLEVNSKNRNAVQEIVEQTRAVLAQAVQLGELSGEGEFLRQKVEIGQVLTDLSWELNKSLQAGQSIVLRLGEERLFIEIDPEHLRELLTLLTGNALSSLLGRAGVVNFRLGAAELCANSLRGMLFSERLVPGHYVLLEVSDNGRGLEPSELLRIFEPFASADVNDLKEQSMARVAGLLRRYGGAASVESTPGHGTTVRVWFPRAFDCQPAETKEPELRASVVLVVDDDPCVLDVTRQVLEHAGFSVLVASSGAEGVKKFAETAVDVVLLDLSMPGPDGVRVFQQMRKVRSGARVILTSGYEEREAVARFPVHELAGFLQKPYTPDVLVSKLSSLLRASEP